MTGSRPASPPDLALPLRQRCGQLDLRDHAGRPSGPSSPTPVLMTTTLQQRSGANSWEQFCAWVTSTNN
ncbi:MAG: hypothetical protein WBN89_03370, partial [Prochlorococcaceae cyanobacterium]